MGIVEIAKITFYICMIPLIIYSLKFYSISIYSLFTRKNRYNFKKIKDLPKVSVHIPVYNDPIVIRCIKKCMQFDYPKNKFEIIVIDDSTDETKHLLDDLHKKNKGFKLMRRKTRKGFKAGALNEALKTSKGEIIVIFDSDYLPGKGFLKKVVQPFHEKKVAFVQTRWGYINPEEGMISKMSSIVYNAFHQSAMPVKQELGTAIFCGSGGAIRKKALIEAGRWNENSITEDLDITIKILDKGYKQIYLPNLTAKGEVPTNLKAFLRQQQRWAYGTTRVMKEYMRKIINSEEMTRKQKIDLVMLTSGFLVFPFILGVTISTSITMAPWFNPSIQPELSFNYLMISTQRMLSTTFSNEGIILWILTSGYLFHCAISLAYERRYKDIVLVPYIYVLGLIVQVTNTIAVFKALLGIKQKFDKTPKSYYRGSGNA